MNYVGGTYFNALSASLIEDILGRARNGTLTVTWRDEVCLPIGAGGHTGGAVYSDAEQLALHAIREMPSAAWEPGRGLGWREALSAWYVDSRNVAMQRYSGATRQLLDREELAVKSLAGILRVRSVAPGGQQLWDRVVLDNNAEMNDRSRILQANLFIQARDRLTASYLAGLAAGGDDVDWQAWFTKRVSTWPADSPATRRARVELAGPSFCTSMQRLPQYWID